MFPHGRRIPPDLQMIPAFHEPGLIQKIRWGVLALVILVVVTIADYLSGFELSHAIFYLISVFIVTWHIGWRSGLVIAVASIACSLLGDLASGAKYSSTLVPWWNMMILFAFYMSMVVVVTKLRNSGRVLESRVRERTAELRQEIVERERLERALLDVSEREQRRIGHDLHDSLCQHLTGTALAAQVLTGKLEGKTLPEAKDAGHLVAMIEDGIDLSRSLARGLAPVELDADGLVTGLRELARHTQGHTAMECEVEISTPSSINDPQITTQLFRIAQEAVRNAVKHSRGKRIVIALQDQAGGMEMTVTDDGTGIPDEARGKDGMGLHIMRHRAMMIGGEFGCTTGAEGTRIRIHIPAKAPSKP